jgi:acyl-homoserine lactone acylase PvdQ
MPGLPMVVLGQNERIAWGFTNTAPDVQDVYLEQIKPDDPTRYRTPDKAGRSSRTSAKPYASRARQTSR